MLATLFILYFYLTTFLEISPHAHTETLLVFTLLYLFLWLQNTPWCICISLHTINPLVVCIFKCSLWLLCGEVVGYWRPESVGWRSRWWSRQEVMWLGVEEVSAVWKKWAQLAHVLELEAAVPHDGQNVMCDAKRGNGITAIFLAWAKIMYKQWNLLGLQFLSQIRKQIQQSAFSTILGRWSGKVYLRRHNW